MKSKIKLHTGINDSLVSAMKLDILEGRYKPPGSILNSGWKRIPAVSKFLLSPEKNENSILKEVGMTRNLAREHEVELTENHSMNRYIKHQVQRFKKYAKTNPDLAWRIAESCIKKSVSFRVSAYNRVHPKWWIEKSITEVMVELKQIEKSIKIMNSNLEYSRVYIPKDEQNWRPLGVPKNEWRVIMHMWANWLTLYLRDSVSKYNHAYMPGLGTKTAWKEVIEKVLKANYIYEFDLKGFFDNVSITEVSDILREKKVPEKIVIFLQNINICVPKFPEELLLMEPILEQRKKMYGPTEEALSDPNLRIWEELKQFEESNGEEMVNMLVEMDGFKNKYDWAMAQWQHLDKISPVKAEFKGLPQGLNSSPILSILTLEKWKDELLQKGIHLTMYADDGIMYSDQAFEVQDNRINELKSKWLKTDGFWQVDRFKYLGLEYLPHEDLLKGKTRKGSTLEFTTKQLGVFALLNDLRDEFSKISADQNLVKLADSSLLGYVQSRLYEGSWRVLEFPRHEVNVHPQSWWERLLKRQWDEHWENGNILNKPENIRSSEAIWFLAEAVKEALKKGSYKSNRFETKTPTEVTWAKSNTIKQASRWNFTRDPDKWEDDFKYLN
jgi:retron-type reverse transcriptase